MPGTLATIISVIVFIMAMPIALPLAMLHHLYINQRRAKCAAATACVNCQKVLGQGSIERADVFWLNYMDERTRANPMLKRRIIRMIWAICECGQKYDYSEKGNCFEVLADLPS